MTDHQPKECEHLNFDTYFNRCPECGMQLTAEQYERMMEEMDAEAPL